MQGQVSNPVMAEPLDDWRWTSFSKTTSKDIRIATYNVLADAYASTKQAKNGMFYYCADEVLSPGPRRQKILRDLLKLDADILGLQEVDTTQLTVLKRCKSLAGSIHTSGDLIRKYLFSVVDLHIGVVCGKLILPAR